MTDEREFIRVVEANYEAIKSGKVPNPVRGNQAKVVGDSVLYPNGHLIPDSELSDVEDRTKGWAIVPRARDLPRWRDVAVSCWDPDGPFTMASRAIKAINGAHAHDYKPKWERETLGLAQLWFVGAPMCDLLVGAAATLPETRLTRELIPDTEGFVIFEAPLGGIDADGTDHSVTVGAYSWGRALWREQARGIQKPTLGISVYGPRTALYGSALDTPRHRLSESPLMPLGGLIWTFDESCDEEHFGGDSRDVSMSEDRRRLLALWLLSAQPSLTSNVLTRQSAVTSKAKAKRIAAGKVRPEAPVRVVQLRRNPNPDADAPDRNQGGRTYRHRWTVSGHWRNQAMGPKRSLRKPIYINPYLKGPDNAPLIGTEKVKSWVR